MLEVMGAFKRPPGFPSMCLLPVITLGFGGSLFFSCHHGRFPLCLNSFPLDSWQRVLGAWHRTGAGEKHGAGLGPAAG